MKPFYVYLLRCSDGSYYVGQTDDIDARMRQHSEGSIGHTSIRRPVELAWTGEFETREGAIAFEQQIKGWSRAKKEALIHGDWEAIKVLAKSRSGGASDSAAPVSSPVQSESPSIRPESAPIRPEPVEGGERLRQAQPERAGGARTPHPSVSSARSSSESISPSVQPEPVESGEWLRQAQPERAGGAHAPHPSVSSARSPSESISPSVRPESAPVRPESSPVRPDSSPVRPDPSPVRPEPVEGGEQPQPVQPEQAEAHDRPTPAPSRSPGPAILDGVLSNGGPIQRRAIAKAITLLESTRADHRTQADELLTALLPSTGHSFRLGISGVPGVGKSTFIETLGLYLIDQGHRVAVLTIDPSSTVSGGSILGDKTRMERLSVHERAYIRPSPSGGTLGGVAEKTREAMLVCEAAGYDVVIVETVGVGQSETAVAGMTDMFVLMQLPNAGDDLQAIKKGVMEIADLVVINKADLDTAAATRAQAQITSALRLFGHQGNPDHAAAAHDAHSGAEVRFWLPKVLQLSALEGTGVDAFWAAVMQFKSLQAANGRLALRREKQATAWMWERIDTGLKQAFRQHPQVRELLPQLTRQVAQGTLPASTAARQLLAAAAVTARP